MKYIQTCQECGHSQAGTEPNLNDPKEKWRDRKCKKCKSEGSLDFGSWQPETPAEVEAAKKFMETYE